MTFTVSMIAYFIEFLIAIDFFNGVFPEKRKKSHTWLTGLALYAVGFTIFTLGKNIIINAVTFFIINLAFALLCYNCSAGHAVLSALLLIIFMSSTEYIFILGSSIAISGDITRYSTNLATYTVGTVLSKLMYFVLAKLTVSWGVIFKENRQTKIPAFLFIFPVCSIVIFYAFWLISSIYTISKEIETIISILSIAIVISIIFTYIFYSKTSKELDELYKAQAEAERINTDIAYYTILDSQNEQLKAFIHDEKNHLTTIKSLSDNPEIHEYIDKLYGEIKTHSSFGNTNNKMLDLMINKYQYICENENIDFSVSIKTANLNYIENTDLITMLGNLLDNSVEAAKVSTEKRIDLSINIANGFDILTCTNSCDSKPLSIGKTLKTTKTDDGVHGLGIKSIKRIAGKYNGNFEWSYDEAAKEFVVYIAFKI